jgi:hypothetical protein
MTTEERLDRLETELTAVKRRNRLLFGPVRRSFYEANGRLPRRFARRSSRLWT